MDVLHDATSEEAEIALVVDDGRWLVTLASDHTDRQAETFDMALSKVACGKVFARTAWRFVAVASPWDSIRVRSWVDGAVPYQDGTASLLMAPNDLVACIPFDVVPASFVVLMGTLPVLGAIRGADRFRAELTCPPLRPIHLDYRVDVIDPFTGAEP